MRSRAFWTTGPGRGEIRSAPLAQPGPDEALVRALCSGVSRGTETLVFRGQVPQSVAELMRAPFQEGDFPAPVKYGYLSVGVVEQGPDQLVGRRVFCLHPHQDRYVVPAEALTPVPDEVPSDRATLAGATETAVNALWDAGPRYGDRIAVVGAGMIGCAVAGLLHQFPLERLQLIDPDPGRATVAGQLGVDWRRPAEAVGDCDLVLHCSATEDGLATSIELLGDEGELVELSWYGDRSPRIPLGGAFHARRLNIRASQVGVVSSARRARRSTSDRLRLALAALRDPMFDALLSQPAPFESMPQLMAELAHGRNEVICQPISYDPI